MTSPEHWLDRAAVALTTPPTSPPLHHVDSDSSAPEPVSRAELLRSVAQRLPDMPPQLDPAWSADAKVPRSTALRLIATLGVALTGARLLRPAAAQADQACVNKCNEMYDKAYMERNAECLRYYRAEGQQDAGQLYWFFANHSSTIFPGFYTYLWCALSPLEATKHERSGCYRQCAKNKKPKRPAPLCPPPAKGARASAACPYGQLPPPPIISPPSASSNCGPSSCEQVGGLCCGPYATVTSTGCETNCSDCKNPYLGPC